MSDDSSEKAPLETESKRRDLGRPWQIILTVLAIFLVSQFVAAFLVGIVEAIIHPHSSVAAALNQSAPGQFFYVLVAEGLAVSLTLLVVRRIRRVGLAAIGLGRWPKWRDASRALLGAGIFYALLISASIIVNFFFPNLNTKEAQNVGFNTLNSSLDWLLAAGALIALPPIGEETLMRGYLYSGLRNRMSFTRAMLITSLLFGLAHLGSGSGGGVLWLAGVDTFLLSLVLVYLRESTGALYAGMLLHAANNVVAFGVHFHALLSF